MALVVINNTLPIAGARDPMWLECRCDGWRTSAPTTASFTLLLVQNPAAGMTFTLLLGDDELVFTYVDAAPDDSGLQVRVGADSTATTAHLLDALLANWHVDQSFVVTEASGTITLTAREPGLVELGFANTAPVTMSFGTVSAGSDGVYAANYTANMQVWLEESWGSGTYAPLPAFDAAPDAALRLVRWNVAALLKPRLGWDWPAYGATALTVLDRLMRRYYVALWEQYGDPPVPKAVGRTAVKVAWMAGSRQAERNTIHEVWNLITSTSVANPFLTYRGRNGRHEVSPGQDHYLAWYRRIPKVSGQQVNALATVTYSDGTTDSAVIATDSNGSQLTEGRVALVSCGFERNGLDELQPDKVPVKYTVAVRNHLEAALSEEHTFWLVPEDFNELHVEYVSSLGAIESLRCTGQWELGMTVGHDEARRLLPVLNQVPRSTQEGEQVQFLREAPKRLQAFTGWMPRGEFQAVLPDLLLSPDRRLVDHERQSRMPLRIGEVQLAVDKRGQRDEWMYGANLELLTEDAETAWSDRLHMPPNPPIDPGGGMEDE